MNNFTKMQNSSGKKIVISQQQQLDPKRRAIREGMLKNLDNKSQTNPELNRFENSGVHPKQKINKESRFGSQVKNPQ